MPPGVKKRFFKHYTSITWRSLIFLFCYYPPLEEDVTLQFTIFEPPFSKDALCQVWLKLAKWFMSRSFLKVLNVFSLCGYYLPFEKCMAFKLNKFESPLPKNASVMFGWNWLSGSWEDLKNCQYIFSLLLLSPLRKRAISFISKKLNPHNQRVFCAKFVWNWPVVLEKKSSMYFHNVAIISLWQRAWPFIWTKLNHL